MISLRLLGSIDLRDEHGEPIDAVLRRPKLLALLAYLAIARPRGFHRRDKLVAMFWPESSQERARHALRQAIYALRREVGENVLVSRGDEEVALSDQVVRVDVIQLETAFEQGREPEAIEMYRAELLSGFFLSGTPEFERWLEGERTWLRARVMQTLHALAGGARVADNEEAALGWAKKALELNPHDETAVQRMLALLAQWGDSSTALAIYKAFAQRLNEDLGAEPSAETQALLHASRTAQVDSESAFRVQDQVTVPPRHDSGTRWRHLLIGATSMLVLGVGAWLAFGGMRSAGNSTYPRTAIAVLPLQNLSGEDPNAYLAGGLDSELRTQLAKVAELKVIGRTSVMAYEGKGRPLQEIAGELGVGSILEGSVQARGERIRVNVQLLDAATGGQLWAESYSGTLDDAFEIQRDVAERVVAAVGETLRASEKRALAAVPTTNAEAYRLYMRGVDYERRAGFQRQDYEIQQELYERAIALDSTFALARAALSRVHKMMAWFGYDHAGERVVSALDEAKIALQLEPDLPQGHFAMGEVHYGLRKDWQAALEEYQLALRGLPNESRLWTAIAAANRRLGNWDDVLVAVEKAKQLDPRDVNPIIDLAGNTLRHLRRYSEALDAYYDALVLAPDLPLVRIMIGETYAVWTGQLDTLRAVLDEMSPVTDLGPMGTASAWRAQLLLWERKPDSLLTFLAGVGNDNFRTKNDGHVPTALFAAWAHEMRGDSVAAWAAFDSARIILDSVVATFVEGQGWETYGARGLALAGLGRRTEALQEARWLQQSWGYQKDAYTRNAAERRARILARSGEADAALDEIERLLAGPSDLTAAMLRLDPIWDPIRPHSRFKELVAKYGR